MHILIISPIPSHPQTQGNSTRIFELGKVLKFFGLTTHFVYVQLEGLSEAQREVMTKFWDFTYFVPVTMQRRKRDPEYWCLDDWYEESLDQLVRQLCQTYKFAMCLVNYVWYSRALKQVPSTVFKIIDSHDLFGGRHRRLIGDGVQPAWFYTSEREEGRGLERADVILAIQDAERTNLQALTSRPVVVAGHLLPQRFLAPRTRIGRIRVGYLASRNPTNVASLSAFIKSVLERPELQSRLDFIAGGTICEAVVPNDFVFKRLGPVPCASSFYASIDLVINPNLGGTGLKIKSVEALSYGKPLLATTDAMAGIRTECDEHACADTGQMCAVLSSITEDPEQLVSLQRRSRSVFQGYQAVQWAALHRLMNRVAEHSRNSEKWHV